MSLSTVNNETGRSIPIFITSKDPFSSDSHNMYRIIIIKSGAGIINLNNTSIIFMAPSILCLNEKDEIFLEKDNSLDADVIYFSPTTIQTEFTLDNINNNAKKLNQLHMRNFFLLLPFFEQNKTYKGIIDMSYGSLKRLSNLSNAIIKETTTFENNFWPCRSRSFFLEILFLIQYLYTEYEEDNNISMISSSSELNEIILYLHTNYSSKITINDLEQKFNINRTTLAQKFVSETGYTIKNYLIQIRIKISSMMLKDTLLPISEIAYRVGFNDTTHFTRTFKKHLNMLPSEFRKIHMNI
ncbi:AraC family transcriptional regulator [Oceanirhabdus sp. W0125-5]|uniref:AraC family transcriptional regulator n=1 Tax=Oceanirhabdus sp. W0125-5 TaxID=2999116 RepID=UPI0022F2F65B|nr:AraC family transcriptional regulator [Oceanirhabdus sp. W0125-5]WBW99101.1 AraC family transcriptional regulator [Oceanirhabdus sp. W0125-5]